MIRDTGLVIVHIYEGRATDSTKACFCSADYVAEPEQLDAGQAASLFENFMASAAPGNYTVRMMRSMKGGNSQRQLSFKKEGAQGVAVGAIAPAMDFAIIQKQMEDRLDARIKQIQAETEMAKLKAELAAAREELKELKQPGSRLGVFADYLAGQVAGHFAGSTTRAVAGTVPAPQTDQEGEESDANEYANKLINHVAEVVGDDLITLLEKLAALPPDEMRKKVKIANTLL